MPARFPVVTEVQASSVPGAVSCTFRSGLRKFTGAKRVKRLPASLSFPCHTVSRPRYSAPYQVTRTRRPRSAAVKGRAVCTTLAPCSASRRSIGAAPMTSAASRIGAEPGRMMSTYGKMLLITGLLCCLDDTTDPRGTKPSVVRYLVTRFAHIGQISSQGICSRAAFPSRPALRQPLAGAVWPRRGG